MNPMMNRIGMNPMTMGSMGINPMMMGSMGMNPMMMGGTGFNSMGGPAAIENSLMSGLLQNLIGGSQTANSMTTSMQMPSIMGGTSKDSFTENLYANQLLDTIGKNHLLSEKLTDIVTSVNRRRAQQNGPHRPVMARNGSPNQIIQQRPPTDNSRMQNQVQQTPKT
ncbi:hypothetical protein MXB_306 [Myxobolus squamalis]|nr:hypothetical protein MXB_306 [Myxobolus squamalis]